MKANGAQAQGVLEQRLAEAEATIGALLSGQIDAVVDPASKTPVLLAKAQDALRESEERFRLERDRAQQYLDVAPVIMLALDLEGRVTLANRYACSVLGWTEDELVGRDWSTTCLPAGIRAEIEAKRANLLAGDLSTGENAIVTRTGEERLIEWSNTLIRDGAGQVIGTFSSGADITERRRAVEALRTVEERKNFALEAAGVGIWDQDFVTGELRWSAITEAHYGLAPGSFDGTFESFLQCIHPDDRETFLTTIGQPMATGSDFTTAHRSLWPDGTVHWLTGEGRIFLDEKGAPLRGLGITMDITKRRMLEEQYLQAQKMEAIGQLAGGVAHDFNNLVSVILGYCEMLLADLDPNDPRQEDIAEIEKAGISAAALTRRLLAFTHKQIIEPTVLDLNAVIKDLQAMLGRLIGEDVKILLGLDARLGAVKADQGQIEQILLNLTVNARDAMPTGGTLTIETANVVLGESDAKVRASMNPGHYVAITVTDSGTGMTPEVQARLFEPFFTTKKVGKGTGLGLATVHGIVTESGGSVKVISEVGKGTTITVYLPRAAVGEVPVKAPLQDPAILPGTGTVLVVDDAAGLRELAKRLLERQGYKVLVAASAEDAMVVFDGNESIDVLLTDVVMPGASGPELTERLIERRPDLKVIYMSGYTEEAIVRHGALTRGISFMHKPFTSETLGAKVREALGR